MKSSGPGIFLVEDLIADTISCIGAGLFRFLIFCVSGRQNYKMAPKISLPNSQD